MKAFPILALLAICASFVAGEEIQKLSAPFSFPQPSQGPSATRVIKNDGLSLAGINGGSAARGVMLTWSLPANTAEGILCVYAMNGSVMQTLHLKTIEGCLWIDMDGRGTATGVFMARLSCRGNVTTLKLIACR